MTHTTRTLAVALMLLCATLSLAHAQNHAKLINADDLWGSPWNLRGDDATIGFFEYGYPYAGHTEFRLNRVSVVNAPDTVPPSRHTTSTIGVAIARGADIAARGIAYRARVTSIYLDELDSQAELLKNAFSFGNFAVTNHSYSARFGWNFNTKFGKWMFLGKKPTPTHPDPFGAYLNESRLFDSIVHATDYILPVVTAGNVRGKGPSVGDTVIYLLFDNTYETAVYAADGTQPLKNGSSGYDCLPPSAVAKNVITVGSVKANLSISSFSQTGPTNDGRVKPDLVALGENVYVVGRDRFLNGYSTHDGTSYAAPAVTGVVAQIQQLFRRFYGYDMPPATTKALLLHTARDLGRPGPDYLYGWGLVDAKAAALLLQQAKTDGDFSVDNELLEDGETHYFEVKAISQNTPIKVTMAWLDPAGPVTEGGPVPAAYSTDTDPRLVNDLDIRIEKYVNGQRVGTTRAFRLNPASPSSAATRGRNFRDNVEQVLIESPDPDAIYRVIIDHTGSLDGGEQQYARCVSGAVIYLPAPSPVQAEQSNIVVKDGGDSPQAFSANLSWQRIAGASSYQIRYRRYGTAQWTYRTSTGNSTTLPGLELGKYYFQVRARRGNRYSYYATRIKTFTVTPVEPANLQSGPVGATSAVVRWTGDVNAEQYRVLYVRINMQGELLDPGWIVKYTPNTATSLLSLAQDTWYAWSVQSIYADGTKSGFAPTEMFLTNTTCNAYEPNNAVDQAAPIETNRNIYARACQDDISDWYSFTVTNDQPNVRIYLYEQPVPLQLQLYHKVNGNTTKLADSPDNGNNTSTKVLTANNLTPGTYYVRVFNPDAASSYSSSQEYPLRVNTRWAPY